MKKKIKKEYIKTNLIGFIIAGIIVSGVAVYAAVTFPSNEVSYSNIESGLNSNNVQGAIDELYETCTALTSGEQIIEDASLEKDPYECRYFFTGANPNNYIRFNNETWRIISVECDGTIKIMREASIGNMAWDLAASNDWSRPSTLNTDLNETYLTNNLNSTAQSQIVSKNWSIGAVVMSNDDLSNQISNENSSKWNGKVALVTLSEYIRSNSNQSNCGTLALQIRNYSSCVNTGWMDTMRVSEWWTLSPSVTNSTYSYYVVSNGQIGNDKVYGVNSATGVYPAVRPATYLSSKVKITGGNGSSSNPYMIE